MRSRPSTSAATARAATDRAATARAATPPEPPARRREPRGPRSPRRPHHRSTPSPSRPNRRPPEPPPRRRPDPAGDQTQPPPIPTRPPAADPPDACSGLGAPAPELGVSAAVGPPKQLDTRSSAYSIRPVGTCHPQTHLPAAQQPTVFALIDDENVIIVEMGIMAVLQ